MKTNKSVSEYNILHKIETRKISQGERMKIKSDFMKYLGQPCGTLQNYPQKSLVIALMEHYPGTLDRNIVEEYTQLKVNTLMSNIYESVIANRKIYANPMIIKMLVDHIRGAEDSSKNGFNQQIVIQNWFPTDDNGKYTRPEQKIEINECD
jgi:hypothetical protein